MADRTLEIENLSVFYGSAQAVDGFSMSLDRGEMLALIGANGAGKSTLFKAICGLVPARRGDVLLGGKRINSFSPNRIVGMGLAMVPEGRRLFRSLSVEENLTIGGHVGRRGPWSLQKVYDVFPALRERRRHPATALSGGQQQMVAIGRALMSNPDVLLLDELSLGLAPIVIKGIYELLPRILGEGLSTILVEQDVARAMSVSDKLICMLEGSITLEGKSHAFSRDQISVAYFGT
jgi:branched-chain amino acid transport system ATP-binding protein